MQFCSKQAVHQGDRYSGWVRNALFLAVRQTLEVDAVWVESSPNNRAGPIAN